jgi:mono/diheme cytochrome c family protein
MLFKLVKDGSPAPDSPMKGWAGKMSDPEIAAVLAYIQSLWPERLRQRYRAMHDQG